jgi:glycosyltransferase involved in cell wall biosynthesis
MLLSIGMIVKNEEKYLRRCLQALVPILEQVNSELIIADTGSTDNTVNIAKEFTKNVFDFEWCNDFAKARNSTLKKATGEWYMQIDADEIITDAMPLIEFFNSGEYKDFNAATYIIRSTNDLALKEYADMISPRIIKIKENSCYIGAVHEKLNHAYYPLKNLPLIVNHYGYVTEQNEEYIAFKMNRNLKIMFSELSEHPDDPFLYLHISNAYRLIKDNQKALAYCEKGLKYGSWMEKSLLYANMIRIHTDLCNYSKVIELADIYFSSKKEKIGTDLEIYYFQALSSFYLGKNQEAIQSYKDYISFFTEFQQGLHQTYDTRCHSINFIDDTYYRTAILQLAKLSIKTNNYKSAKSYLRSLPKTNFLKDKNNVFLWLSIEIELMGKLKNYNGLAELYEQSDKTAQEMIQKILESELQNEGCRPLIFQYFTGLHEPKSLFARFMELRADYDANRLTAEFVNNFINEMEEWTPIFADAVYFAFKTGLPLEFIANKIDAYDIDALFYKNKYYHYDNLAYLVLPLFSKTELDTNSRLWVSFLFFCELISDEIQENYIFDLFAAYAKLSFSCMSTMFKEEILNEKNLQLLPKQFRIAFYCYMAIKAKDNNQYTQYFHYLKIALQCCPQLKKTVGYLAEQIQNDIDDANKKKKEFDNYANKVKESIRILISQGKINEAAEFIKSYEKLCPGDTEIEILKNKI